MIIFIFLMITIQLSSGVTSTEEIESITLSPEAQELYRQLLSNDDGYVDIERSERLELFLDRIVVDSPEIDSSDNDLPTKR